MTEKNPQIRRKEFAYRGKNIEDLKKLDVREFAKYMTSRQRRTTLRQFQKIENFISRAKEKISRGKKIRTHERDLIITPSMVGMTISIYNGKEFVPIEIRAEMLGHVLGELAPTRRKITHGSAGVGATKGSKHKAKK